LVCVFAVGIQPQRRHEQANLEELSKVMANRISIRCKRRAYIRS